MGEVTNLRRKKKEMRHNQDNFPTFVIENKYFSHEIWSFCFLNCESCLSPLANYITLLIETKPIQKVNVCTTISVM